MYKDDYHDLVYHRERGRKTCGGAKKLLRTRLAPDGAAVPMRPGPPGAGNIQGRKPRAAALRDGHERPPE